MKQLGQLQEYASQFKSLNAELIFVFREESKGVEGLKKIQARVPTQFTLAVDPNKKSSKDYSPQPRTFDNYVIDSNGKVRAVIDGTLRERAKAEQIIKVLKEIADSN